MEVGNPQFWVALMQIIGVNIVLSGDNAVVIALAARSLPPKQQKQAVLWGSGAAVVMRIVLTIVAVELLRLPYLKLIGAALLLWIGIQLLLPEHEEEGGADKSTASMAAAVRTILIADLVMSLDNVIAVAAAAKGSLTLLVIGLLVSIPLVIFGSTFLMKFMERWPIIVTFGGALLGYVAGEMAVGDPAVKDWIDANMHWLHYVLPALGAALVVIIGKWMSARAEQEDDARPAVDLAGAGDQPPGAVAESTATHYLLAVDGSAGSMRAVDRLIQQVGTSGQSVLVHLLNTQPPVHGDVSMFVEEGQLKGYHHEEAAKLLQPAREKLTQAKIPFVVHIGVGNPAHVIAHFANEKKCRQIIMAEIAGTDLVGAVSSDIGKRTSVPVTVVS